jgi:hypothetical protein
LRAGAQPKPVVVSLMSVSVFVTVFASIRRRDEHNVDEHNRSEEDALPCRLDRWMSSNGFMTPPLSTPVPLAHGNTTITGT